MVNIFHHLDYALAVFPLYTLFQGAVFLQYRGLQLQPDVVLLYFGYNDFQKVAFRDERDSLADETSPGLTDRQLFESRQRPVARLADSLFRRSSFVRRLGAAIAGARSASLGGDQIRLAQSLQRVPEEDRWSSLERILELCRREGIELVLIVPRYRSFTGHAPLLRRFAAEHELPLVDLPTAIPEEADYFTDASHPNAAGHARIAEEIWNVAGDGWIAGLR